MVVQKFSEGVLTTCFLELPEIVKFSYGFVRMRSYFSLLLSFVVTLFCEFCGHPRYINKIVNLLVLNLTKSIDTLTIYS